MPKPKRPRDPNQLAKIVVDIAIGERLNDGGPQKDSEAVESGRKGGKARAAKLSKKRRSEIAKKAARVRWATQK